MNNKFDLERFKAGEPAYFESDEFYYIGMLRYEKYTVCAGTVGGIIYRIATDGRSSHGNIVLEMKPELKQIDWSKLQFDTRLILPNGSKFYADGNGGYSACLTWECQSSYPWKDGITIAPEQQWSVWQGGECPLPDGLEFEVITRGGAALLIDRGSNQVIWSYAQHGLHSMSEIIAYRLTGKVLEGWTLS